MTPHSPHQFIIVNLSQPTFGPSQILHNFGICNTSSFTPGRATYLGVVLAQGRRVPSAAHLCGGEGRSLTAGPERVGFSIMRTSQRVGQAFFLPLSLSPKIPHSGTSSRPQLPSVRLAIVLHLPKIPLFVSTLDALPSATVEDGAYCYHSCTSASVASLQPRSSLCRPPTRAKPACSVVAALASTS